MTIPIGTPVLLRGPAALDCSVLRIELRSGEHARGVTSSPVHPSGSVGVPDSVAVEFVDFGRADVDPLRLEIVADGTVDA